MAERLTSSWFDHPTRRLTHSTLAASRTPAMVAMHLVKRSVREILAADSAPGIEGEIDAAAEDLLPRHDPCHRC